MISASPNYPKDDENVEPDKYFPDNQFVVPVPQQEDGRPAIQQLLFYLQQEAR